MKFTTSMISVDRSTFSKRDIFLNIEMGIITSTTAATLTMMDRGSERIAGTSKSKLFLTICVCVCVCVRERERDDQRVTYLLIL